MKYVEYPMGNGEVVQELTTYGVQEACALSVACVNGLAEATGLYGSFRTRAPRLLQFLHGQTLERYRLRSPGNQLLLVVNSIAQQGIKKTDEDEKNSLEIIFGGNYPSAAKDALVGLVQERERAKFYMGEHIAPFVDLAEVMVDQIEPKTYYGFAPPQPNF